LLRLVAESCDRASVLIAFALLPDIVGRRLHRRVFLRKRARELHQESGAQWNRKAG
jgi:hypothetical protein